MTSIKDSEVEAGPVKSFFVDMLTRDISVQDSILDLLDNCIDGILRVTYPKTPKNYDGYWAKIAFDSKSFSIEDNCGGIPWDRRNYTFRMGPTTKSTDSKIPTVGTYGIGLKRAVFKLGTETIVTTRHEKKTYEVHIRPDWLKDEINWKLPLSVLPKQPITQQGTRVLVKSVQEGVGQIFKNDKENFQKELLKAISTHYAYILDKGFKVTVNGKAAVATVPKLLYDAAASGIKPYIYETENDGVQVYLSLGFTSPTLPDVTSADDEELSFKSAMAGWTILCNDRAVVYCDKTELTGWGEAGVPRYHTQFIAISGIVEFRSNDSRKLPTTTTKRGIDHSSILYLQVKERMREALKVFIRFTNDWKSREEEARRVMKKAHPVTISELRVKAKKLKFSNITKGAGGKQYKPTLPRPQAAPKSIVRLSFSRAVSDVKLVSEFLFDVDDVDPSEVGAKCFDLYLEEVKQ